jgi:hypothetical protein
MYEYFTLCILLWFSIKCYLYISSPHVCATRPAHLVYLGLITRKVSLFIYLIVVYLTTPFQ